jgi:DNA helicase-2/ATP-dependent DNA helicase PcrA
MSAALLYEESLRSQGRVDFDDVIRLGHLVLADARVRDLYRVAFPAVVVDEVQDLSTGQLELARYIGDGATVYAGDVAQGIYGFAGAEPAAVLQQIRDESPREYELSESFRSSPAVLRVVSAVRQALGGGALTSAVPEDWEDRGSVRLLRTRHVDDEANAVTTLVKEWCELFPDASVAVIARSGSRRRALDRAVADAGLDAEIWDFPVHRPLIAELLSRHVEIALLAGDRQAVMQELYNRCLIDLDQNDLDALDELQDACDAIEDLQRDGYELSEIVAGIRISSDPDAPVGPGLHLLNGHVGKGQQFDRVVVLGLEEAILPHFAAMLAERRGDVAQVNEELAVLHVMVSRAREDLVIAVADVVPKWNGSDHQRTPSRFLRLITPVIDEVVDLR